MNNNFVSGLKVTLFDGNLCHILIIYFVRLLTSSKRYIKAVASLHCQIEVACLELSIS